LKVDKVYLAAPSKIAIIDHEKKKTFVVTKEGLPDAGKLDSMSTFFPIRAIQHCCCKVHHSLSYYALFCSCLEPLGQEG
jgi:hypothetical protein